MKLLLVRVAAWFAPMVSRAYVVMWFFIPFCFVSSRRGSLGSIFALIRSNFKSINCSNCSAGRQALKQRWRHRIFVLTEKWLPNRTWAWFDVSKVSQIHEISLHWCKPKQLYIWLVHARKSICALVPSLGVKPLVVEDTSNPFERCLHILIGLPRRFVRPSYLQ